MKRYKKLFILIGVLAAVVLTTLAVKNHKTKEEQIKNTDAVILAVSPDSVTSLAWDYSVYSYAFTKTDKWHRDGDEAFPVNGAALEKLLSVFQSFGAAFIIEDVEDFGQYGLEKPVATIRFTAGGKEHTVLLGSFSTLDSQRYVSIGDGNVYLVKKDPLDSFNISLTELFLQDSVPTFGTVTELSFSGSENYSLRREENNPAAIFADDCYYTEINGETLPLDTELVDRYCRSLGSLKLSDYACYQITDEELAARGLKDPELNITVRYRSADAKEDEAPEVFVLHVGRDPKQLEEKAEAEKNGETYTSSVTAYARVGESSILYTLSASDYKALAAAGVDDLRHKEAAVFETESITALNVLLDGSSYTIGSSLIADEDDPENKKRVFSYLNEEISADDIKTALRTLSVTEFTDEAPSGKEELRLTVTLEDAGPASCELVLYRLNGSSCLAAVNGKTLGRVSRSSAVGLIEAIYRIVLG